MSRTKSTCKLLLYKARTCLLPLLPAPIFCLFLLTAPLSVIARRTQYAGIYGNAAGDDGVSDTLYTEIEISGDRFSLRFATRDGIRESGRTGKMPQKQIMGTWAVDTSATGLDITYYRPGQQRGDPPMANVEHYTPADGDIVVLQFPGRRKMWGIFTTKHFPDLPPALCLAWGGDRNMVFASWRDNRNGGVMIRNSARRQ